MRRDCVGRWDGWGQEARLDPGRPIAHAAIASALAALAACSSGAEVTEARLQEVRRNVVGPRTAFEQTASVLVPSSITWANRKSVRYKAGTSYQTESWDAAQLPPTLKAELQAFMSARKVEAIFVHERRVNFVLSGTGIAPSGVSVGVVVAPGNEHGCQSISTPLKLDGQGLNCEKLDGLSYLYVQR